MRVKIALFALVHLALSYFFAVLASKLYYNPRPFVEHHFKPLIKHEIENGFPSHHALLVSAIAVILSIFNKKISVVSWLIALAVAIARVYVGVHHILDVTAGFVITIVTGVVLSTSPFMDLVNKGSSKLLEVNRKK